MVTDMLLIIKRTGNGLLKFINIDDLERSCTPKIKVLVNFSQFLAAAQISKLNCDEMAGYI